MGSLLPLSITTNCTMKSLLIFATLLAVGLSEETKAIVAPYTYGIPGYYGGVAAPFAYNAAPLNYAFAPQTSYPYTYAPYAQAYAPVAAAAPAPVATIAAAPVVAPYAPSSQFAAGDEFGNSQFGYSNLHSSKHEIGNGFGQKSGSYQYVDPAGKLQTVTYVADELGFRVADSRLPVHNAAAPVHDAELPVAPVHEYELPVAPVHEYTLPVAPVYDGVAPEAPVYDGVAPEPVQDTPEVAAAKAEFAAAFEEVASRTKRESDPMLTFGYNSPYILNPAFQRFAYNGIYAYNHMAHIRHPRFSYGFYY